MRIVEISPHKETSREVFQAATETHYIGVYNPPVQKTVAFMDRSEALQRAKNLIPLIDSTRNAIKINTCKTKATTRAS